MDFEFYRNFITVAETGNLTTASKNWPWPSRPSAPRSKRWSTITAPS